MSRRGELHRMFRAERIPGLLDYLMKSATLEQVLRPTSKRNLTLLPCGTRRQHGPELLGSALMNELMATLKTRYNVIIVDSPPLGAGIDPFVLGTATEALRLLTKALPAHKARPDDMATRLDLQFGMWLSIGAGTSGGNVFEPAGASEVRKATLSIQLKPHVVVGLHLVLCAAP